MLHRTQARQVEGVYQMFMRRYPDIRALAEAPREEVIEVLAPLGLNWRIHGMLNAFRQIWKQHGSVPLDMEKLVEVKGIGPYIAGSTLCFSADRPLPLVDSNTVRVIGRVFGLDLRGEARRRAEVREAISAACDPEHPREFYYSLIDLAHSVCLPRGPRCGECPLSTLPCEFVQASEQKSAERGR